MNVSTSHSPKTEERCGVASVTPQTFLDFPGKIAAIFWFAPCNFRCPYCYNPHLVKPSADASFHTIDGLRKFLLERRTFLDAVVMSGGESTLSPQLPEICRLAKSLGYLVKIDTNGSMPHVLSMLLKKKLIDSVSLDIKATEGNWQLFSNDPNIEAKFCQSLELLLEYGIDFEVRTTSHPDITDEAAISSMAHQLHALGYRGPFAIQSFFKGAPTLSSLDPEPRPLRPDSIISPLPLIFR